MNFISKLFSSKTEPEKRTSKLEQLDSMSTEALEAIASSGQESDEVRLAAIPRLTWGRALIDLAQKPNEIPKIETAAKQRIAVLLDAGGISPETLTSEIHEVENQITIAGYCKKAQCDELILSRIDDQAVMAKLSKQTHASNVRRMLAEKISEPELLKDLSKHFKAKDKNAYKIVKAKLDTIRAQEREKEEAIQRLNEVLSEVQHHASRAADKEYGSRLQRYQRRWAEYQSFASDELSKQFDDEVKACALVLATYEAAEAEQIEREKQISQLDQNRQAIIENAWQLINTIYELENNEDASLSPVAESLVTLKEEWQNLKQLGQPPKSEIKDFTQISETIEILAADTKQLGALKTIAAQVEKSSELESGELKILKRLLAPVGRFSERFELAQAAKDAITLIKKLDVDYENQQKEYEKQIKFLSGLIRKAERAANEGRLKQAIGIRHSIEEKAEGVGALPSYLTRHLEGLDETIQKLVDWQAYAVVPKKESLVTAMQNLIGSELPPEALATKIKKLQDEWRGLSQSGKDRHEDLWQQFSEAADKAYIPCKEHFQGLADERAANLEKRRQLVSQLQDFDREYSWEAADWKYVEKIIRTARTELHEYSPVDRAANKPVSDLFDEAITAIQAKLHAEFDKNKAAKEQLIAQAEKLESIADIQQAIDTAKRLQNQWKAIGRCHYRDSDKLWKDFRAHCDKVFEKKGQQDAEARKVIDDRIREAEVCVEKLKAIVALPTEEIASKRTEKDELQSVFQEIQDIPEKVQRAISREFNKTLDAFEQKLESVQKEKENTAWLRFFEACKRVNHYGLAANGDDSNPLKEELESFIQSVNVWPDGGQSLMTKKIEQLAGHADYNVEENLKDLKLLCVRAEILADRESPASDKALRMEYQVNMLQKGLGGQKQANGQLVGMAKEWGQVGPVEEQEYEALFKRFYESWQTIPA